MSGGAMNTELPEREDGLWIVLASPAIWAAHFFLSYGTAAIWCAKFASPDGSLGVVRWAVAAYTAAALAGIAAVARRGSRRRRLGASGTNDLDTPADRRRFLGFTVVIVSVLCAIAVVYGALPAVFIGSCL
jgi:hypothetical protein